MMCPAVGQGALAIETREDHGAARQICSRLDNPGSRTAVTAERAVLARLGGGCQVPIGAYATVDAGTLHLRAVVVSPDGRNVIRKRTSGPTDRAEILGRETGDALLAEGGRQILEAVYGAPADAGLRT